MLRAAPPGHPLQKPTVVQWDIGAMLSADGAADESVSPQSGITVAHRRKSLQTKHETSSAPLFSAIWCGLLLLLQGDAARAVLDHAFEGAPQHCRVGGVRLVLQRPQDAAGDR